MTLSTRIALVRGAYWPVVLLMMAFTALVGLALERNPGGEILGATVGVALLVTVAWPPLSKRLRVRIIKQHYLRIEAAADEGDDEALRRLLDEVDEYLRRFSPHAERHRMGHRAHVLVSDEKWSEALAVIGQIDRDALPASERVHHDNRLAWTYAHAGETARAVELARANLDAPADAKTRVFLLGTLGSALVLDGQHAAALAPLRESIALGGPRWAQAVRHCYLGDALAALGRLDEARNEWQQAVAIAPRSRWGRRAQERLDSGAPAAYR